MKFSFLYIALLLPFFSCNNKSLKFKKGDAITGKVIAIIDGDTYDILLPGNEKVRIRMEGIDAPEKGMPFYKTSKKYLSDLCFKKEVTLQVTGKDKRGRTLAFSYIDDSIELSHEMIKAGLAWHYKEYNTDTDLSELEIKARNSKIGIWSNENPMPPWINKELHRKGISTKDSFDIKDNEQ